MSSSRFVALANRCRELADQTANEPLRLAWLNLAQSWLQLAHESETQTPEARFDAEAAAKGTGQDSTSSH